MYMAIFFRAHRDGVLGVPQHVVRALDRPKQVAYGMIRYGANLMVDWPSTPCHLGPGS